MRRKTLAVLTVFSLLITTFVLDDIVSWKDVKISLRKFVTKSFVDRNLGLMVEEQEKILGIKYGSVPKVFYTNPRGAVSSYCVDEEGSIRLAADSVYFELLESSWTNKTLGFFLGGDKSVTLKSTLHHELAHHYVYGLIRKICVVGYKMPTSGHSESGEESDELMNRLIQEGIADYVEDKMSKKPRRVDDLKSVVVDMDYFKDKRNDFYSRALELVRPIIDEFGKRGIEYLVYHSLDGKNLSDLLNFQKKALSELQNGWILSSLYLWERHIDIVNRILYNPVGINVRF